eukprot:scaffold28301_cov32-Prasinocladus_malaysianus.AAC.1
MRAASTAAAFSLSGPSTLDRRPSASVLTKAGEPGAPWDGVSGVCRRRLPRVGVALELKREDCGVPWPERSWGAKSREL